MLAKCESKEVCRVVDLKVFSHDCHSFDKSLVNSSKFLLFSQVIWLPGGEEFESRDRWWRSYGHDAGSRIISQGY